MRMACWPVSIMASPLSATWLHCAPSGGVNSCLIQWFSHSSVKFPLNSLPPSDRTASTEPSVRVSARKRLNHCAASLFIHRKYTHVIQEKSSRTIMIYRFFPGTCISSQYTIKGLITQDGFHVLSVRREPSRTIL